MLGYHYRRRVEPESVPRNYEFGLVDRQGGVRDVIITISLIPGTKRVSPPSPTSRIEEGRGAAPGVRGPLPDDLRDDGDGDDHRRGDTTVTLVNTGVEKLSGAPKEYWESGRSCRSSSTSTTWNGC